MRISDWSSDVCSSDLIGHTQVEHPLLVGGEIIAVGLERREHHRAAFGFPEPFVGRARAFGGAARADAEMAAIPIGETFGIACPEEQSAYSLYRHRPAPQTRPRSFAWPPRSEEHTSELQSLMRI